MLLTTIGIARDGRGCRFDEAERMLLQSIELLSSELGPDDPRVLECKASCGLSYRLHGASTGGRLPCRVITS